MFKLIPLTKLVINWDDYIKTIKAVLSFSPVEDLEKKKIPIEGVSSFIRSLELLTEPPNTLNHVFYSFLIIGSKEFYFQLLKYSFDLKIDTYETEQIDVHLGIISGTLKSWKQVIVDNNQSSSPNNVNNLIELRYFFNQIQNYFENMEGLFRVFSDLNKIDMHDGSYKLKMLMNKQ